MTNNICIITQSSILSPLTHWLFHSLLAKPWWRVISLSLGLHKRPSEVGIPTGPREPITHWSFPRMHCAWSIFRLANHTVDANQPISDHVSYPTNSPAATKTVSQQIPGFTVSMGSAKERRRYNATSSLTGWGHTWNDSLKYPPATNISCIQKAWLIILCPHYTLVTLFTMYPRSHKNAGVHRSYLDLSWSAKIRVFYALFRL